MAIRLTVAAAPRVLLSVIAAPAIALRVEPATVVHTEGDPYDGPYAVTPARVAQTLATAGKSLAADVVVGAIPSNYGLITHDGFGIMIS